MWKSGQAVGMFKTLRFKMAIFSLFLVSIIVSSYYLHKRLAAFRIVEAQEVLDCEPGCARWASLFDNMEYAYHNNISSIYSSFRQSVLNSIDSGSIVGIKSSLERRLFYCTDVKYDKWISNHRQFFDEVGQYGENIIFLQCKRTIQKSNSQSHRDLSIRITVLATDTLPPRFYIDTEVRPYSS